MDIRISTLTVDDIDDVDHLMKSNSATLGFLTRAALHDYLSKGTVIGAFGEDNQLVGYLLYGVTQGYFRITHLCISKSSRERGIARTLVAELKSRATTQQLITLHCRRDFQANKLWPKLGFIPASEKAGRSKEGLPLTHWNLLLDAKSQLSFSQAASSNATIDVAIDAQIFFDLLSENADRKPESRALVSDFMVGLVSLRVTDELFVEINRNLDIVRRKSHREQADNFHQIRHEVHLAEHFEASLKAILPSNSDRALSDIRHLAKTAASGIKYFVTRDKGLMNKRVEIADLTELKVLSPTELIVQVHELVDHAEFAKEGILGLNLHKRRLRSSDIGALQFESFIARHEGKGEFLGKLKHYLADPNCYRCDLFESTGEIVAIRIHEYVSNRAITIHLARAESGKDRQLLEPHLVADTIREAVASKITMVEFRDSSTSSRLRPTLLKMGFVATNEKLIRFCFSGYLPRNTILSRISKTRPEVLPFYENISDHELEQHCSPVAISAPTNYFLMPIRPGFAISLVDWQQSADDLFGGRESVLLRWDHIYYRSNTRHKMLRPPGRILWYVSAHSRKRNLGRQGKVVAVSHLDLVELDCPKRLFRKHQHKGILDWNQIQQICGGNANKTIMAIEFSHTFTFKKPIPLDDLRRIYREGGSKLMLQSPSKIPPPIFERLYRFGFEV